MSEHRARLEWKRTTDDFTYEAYTRNHRWVFANGSSIEASAAAEFRGDASKVDPEAAFVASLSSCHMLTFLAIASRQRWVVDSYTDDAVGHLEKNDAGRLALTRVELRPRVEFGGERRPTQAQLQRMHEAAHHECFLANSVKTAITVEKP